MGRAVRRSSANHRFRADGQEHVLVVPHSRLFDLPAELAAQVDAGDEGPVGLLFALAQPVGEERPLDEVGGEPFVNRRIIHHIADYAVERGRAHGIDVRFAVTTNATLLDDDDLALLRRHAFGVTSLDGGRTIHDRQRPSLTGRSAFSLLEPSVRALLADPGQARVAARATITRHFDRLGDRSDAIAELGFIDIGFAPLRVTAAADLAFRDQDWTGYLEGCQEIARRELDRALAGGGIRFSNFAVALKQIHRGASSPYPCGAAGGYFSVSTAGTWYACHRAIGDRRYELGTTAAGLDDDRRAALLRGHHVHAQEPCGSCWARYLCSGGCHHEASARTPASCDLIRGWLQQ